MVSDCLIPLNTKVPLDLLFSSKCVEAFLHLLSEPASQFVIRHPTYTDHCLLSNLFFSFVILVSCFVTVSARTNEVPYFLLCGFDVHNTLR